MFVLTTIIVLYSQSISVMHTKNRSSEKRESSGTYDIEFTINFVLSSLIFNEQLTVTKPKESEIL